MSLWQPSAGDQLPFYGVTGGWSGLHYKVVGPDGGGNWHLARNDQINTSTPYTSGCYYNPSNGNLSTDSSWNASYPVYLTLSNTHATTTNITVLPGDAVYAWGPTAGDFLGVFDIPSGSGGNTGGSGGNSGGSGGNSGGSGATATVTFDANRAMTVTIDSSSPSGTYDLYQDVTLLISLQHTTGTTTTLGSPGPFPDTYQYTIKYDGNVIFYEPRVVAFSKVSCNFW